MQQIKINITFRAFRETGTLILFYPEGRTYSPLRRRKVRLPPFPPLAKTSAASLLLLSPQSLQLCGVPLKAVVVRSARRIRLLRKPTDNEHLFRNAVIVRTDGYFDTVTVCLRKSATGSFVAAMSIVYATLIFFLRKETKTERMMIFIGNIPP